MKPNLTDKQRKVGQWILFGALFLGLVSVVIAVMEPPETNQPFSEDKSPVRQVDITKLTDGARQEDRWLEVSGLELKKMWSEIENLKSGGNISRSEFINLKTDFEELKRDKEADAQNAEKLIADVTDLNRGLTDEVTILRQKLEEVQQRNSGSGTSSSRPVAPANPFRTVGRTNTNPSTQPYDEVNLANTIDFELSEVPGTITTFDTSTYIPAGSYVKAKIIEGVSASVGLIAGTDPRPIEFRVEGKAISAIGPNGPETFDLDGCVAIGAARGDLSSERVYVQLLKLTCSHQEGTVFEVPIKAHVSSGGQAGIRGTVVKRDNEYTQKSFLAGLFSGGGEGLNALATPPATFGGSGFATQERPSLTDVAGMAAGKGFSSAGERLSDYYIKQAEQYQPVVEVTPGIPVEIVFTEGVQLNVG